MSNRTSGDSLTRKARQAALRFGAHLAGVASVERLREAPPGYRATDLLPDARSVVVLGIGLPQGLGDCWRASVWSYLYYGYAIPNKQLGHAAFRLATWLQHHGHSSFPVVPTLFMKDCDVLNPRGEFSHRHAAFAAGLGEFGWNGLFMTPQFGCHNRFVSVLTSAELRPDPLYAGPTLCDRCGKCVQACPTGAFRADRPGKVAIAGKTAEYAGLDKLACSFCLVGLAREAGGCLDVRAPKRERTWTKWDFVLGKIRYFLKDPIRAHVQSEYQHVVDWGDFRGLCLHACDRPLRKKKWDPGLLLESV